MRGLSSRRHSFALRSVLMHATCMHVTCARELGGGGHLTVTGSMRRELVLCDEAISTVQPQNHLCDLRDIPCIVDPAVGSPIEREAVLLKGLLQTNL